MLRLEKLKLWYRDAPAPISWLLMLAVLYVWLLIVSSFGSILNGGYDRLASNLPSYAKSTGLKLLGLYSIAVVIYLAVRLVGLRNRRSSRLEQDAPRDIDPD